MAPTRGLPPRLRHAEALAEAEPLPLSRRSFSEDGTRRDFWEAKLTANKQRDSRNLAALHSLGYTVLTIWECEIKSILTTRTIPNLPPREAATPAPDYSPLPDTPLIAADSTLLSLSPNPGIFTPPHLATCRDY